MTEKILCRFHTQGNCRYGTSCRFSHDLSHVPSQVCSYFLAGYCAYGKQCRFVHLQPDGMPVPGEDVALPSTREPESHTSSITQAEDPGHTSQQVDAEASRTYEAWDGTEGEWMGYPEDTSFDAVEACLAEKDDERWAKWYYGRIHDALDQDSQQVLEAESVEAAASQHGQRSRLPMPVDLGDACSKSHRRMGRRRSGSSSGESHEQYRNQEDYGEHGAGYSAEGYAEYVQYYTDHGIGMSSIEDTYASSEQGNLSTGLKVAQQVPAWRGFDGGHARELCPEYSRTGFCSRGDNCSWIHGSYCQTCQKYALHPADEERRREHASECQRRHDRIQALARSQNVECNICMDVVMQKDKPSERKFGLLDCEHAFCLGCIRSWRSNTEGEADISTAVRTCPVCRQTTHFVTPSVTWPASKEEKAAIIDAYKTKLSQIDCRHFSYGDETCPFGTSCMYKHAYRNGQLEDRTYRKRVDAEGHVQGVQSSRLSDFVAESLQAQRALRRSLTRTVNV